MLKRSWLPIFFLGLALIPMNADDVVNYVPGQVIVKRTPGAVAQGLAAFGYSTLEKVPDAGYEVVATRPGQTVEAAIAELSSRGDVVIAQPNYIYRAMAFTPNDPLFSTQYALSLINARDAWGVSRGSSSETIAIIDSGADTTHIDLVDTRFRTVAFGDIIGNDSDVADTPSGSGHGTGVAGIAAANTNNLLQVSGIDWFSNLLPIRVLSGASATGTSLDIDSGIRHAIRHRATVINLSLGFGSSSVDAIVEAALVAAAAQNIVVVAAAGNSGASPVIYPASSTNAIGVGASTSADAWATFSSFGASSGLTGVDVVAPGENILMLGLNSTTKTASGTSFSTPIVTGAAALARSARPGLTPAQFLGFLRSTATDIGEAGFDDKTGAGRIDLFRLLRVLAGRPTFGDSLAVADTSSAALAGGSGRQAQQSFLMAGPASYIGYFQKHGSGTGTIQFYWKSDSEPTSDTRFIVTQRGNLSHSSGHIDLIYRSDKKLEYRLQDSGTLVSATPLNLGQWYHIALTYGPGGMTLAINGDSQASNAVTGGPPLADTIFFGAPFAFGSAQTAVGRLTSPVLRNSQDTLFPSALFVKVERPATTAVGGLGIASALTTEVGNALITWKAYQTETNGITINVYADTDQNGFNGTLLASNLANDEYESVSIASLTLGQTYYIYIVATDSTTALNASPERAYAYSGATITASAPAVVAVTGSAGAPSSGPCLLGRLPGDHSWMRMVRDALMETRFGRFCAGAYYILFS